MNPGPRTHYERLAALFEYPERDYPIRVRDARDALTGRYPAAAAEIDVFARMLPLNGGAFTPEALDEVQEIFTRTFDVQAITTLAVGYVMFGDDYQRGELLVNLSREHEEAGLDCGSELPDHLPNVLRLMARWEDRGLAEEFAAEILHPVLERMIADFGPGRIERRNALYQKQLKTLIVSSAERATMFLKPLAAVRDVVKRDFGLSDRKPPEQDNDFLHSISRELEIEVNEGGRAAPGRMP